MKLSKAISEAMSKTPAKQEVSNTYCPANGCPLPGAISPSIGPNGTFYCRFHFNEPAEKWNDITRRIRSGELLSREQQGREDYKRYITEKFIKEGMNADLGTQEINK